MFKCIRYWNIWRKKYSNGLIDSLAVLLGLRKPASFALIAMAEEQKEWGKTLDEARKAIERLRNAVTDISTKIEKGE